MKKFYLLLTLLLVAFVSRAEIVVDNLTATNLGLKASYNFVEGKTFTSKTNYAAYAMKSDANHGSCIQINKGYKSKTTNYYGIYNTTTVGNARKVEVAWNSNTDNERVLQIYGKATPFVYNSGKAYSAQGGTLIGEITLVDKTVDLTGSLDITDNYPYIAIVSSTEKLSGGVQYIESLKITWETGGETTECAAPTFSVEGGTHYGFDAETKQVSLSCSTEGATIMYSTDGEKYNAYKDPISITCPSTTTISAYATMKGKNSATVSKTYNYVVYPGVESIAKFKEQGAADADKTKPYMFTCPLTVTYQNGNRLYLRDEAGDAILVYGTIDQTYTAGNQLPANSVVGTYKVYNQMVEIIPVEGVEWPTTETIVDASPVEMTIEQLNTVSAEQWSTIASKLVVIKGAKVSADGSTITVGDALSFANGYAKRFNPTLENASAVYDVVGIIETHWTNNIVDGIQFCQTAYLDNYSPAKLYMMGKIQSHKQVWNPKQGIVMEKEAAGIYSADVNLSFDDFFAITTDLAQFDDDGGWAYVNGIRYAYNGGLAKMATDYKMTKDVDASTHVFWTGNFKVTVNFPANTISFVPAAVDAKGEPDYSTVFPEKLRIVGAIADGNWSGLSVVENHLATREADGCTYTFNELQFVGNGEFHFTTAWNAENWNTVNSFAIKAATAEESKINFDVTANILPFTANNLFADVKDYGENGYVYANLQLFVNLKDMTVKGMMYSGVSQIKVGGATVTATNGTIRVDGGNTTSIYNIAGQAIALGSKAKEFSVASGMYIVNVDGKATKVVVR